MTFQSHTPLGQHRPVVSTNASHSWARLDGVDVLRGLAIFFVLMNHVNMRLSLAKISYTQGLPSQLVSSLVWNGQYGVQMFFAVSGFLITATSIRRWGSLSRISVSYFYALRFARIAPLLLLLLVVLCALHVAGFKDYIVSDETGGLIRALIAALTFHVNLLEAHRGYLPGNWDVLWSLSVEEMFYLFFPPLCWLLGRSKWLAAFFLILVVLGPIDRAVLAQGNEVWQEYSYLGGMDAIALGCLTAIATMRYVHTGRITRMLGSLGTILVVFILGFSDQATAWGLHRSGLDMTILAVGSCMIISAAAATQWEGPRVLFPILLLGRRSYEIYLTHMFVVLICFRAFQSEGRSLAAIPGLFISVILFSSVLGESVARFYSEPMNRRLRQLFADGSDGLGSVVRSDAAE